MIAGSTNTGMVQRWGRQSKADSWCQHGSVTYRNQKNVFISWASRMSALCLTLGIEEQTKQKSVLLSDGGDI